MRHARRALALVAGTAAAAVAVAVGSAAWQLPDYADLPARFPSSDAKLLDRSGELLQSVRLDHRVRRLDWVPLADISPRLVEAVLSVEDRRFHRHPGVDPLAIGAALRDAAAGRGLRGASTITMQLATQLAAQREPQGSPRRGSWAGKLAQLRDALALELRYDKRGILEAYLNVVTWRGELAGIDAGARGLFGKAPSALDETEAWLLASALRSPGAPAATVLRRACGLARWDATRCTGPAARVAAAFDGPVSIPPAASLAPHLARRLLRTPGEQVRTSIDAGLQAFVLQALRAQLEQLSAERVRDGAAIVVDNATGEVLAYVGSAGPASRASLVDAARAPRQAGSTLKPFLYALALQERLLTPASLLDDSPVDVTTAAGAWVPQNYDRSFRGLTSLRVALASSLNVPAVRTLLLLGPDALHRQLRAVGYAGLADDPDHYGYSLALGSADVTLLEQVNAYRTLANGGRFSPLRFATGEAPAAGEPVIDARAAWLVGDILADRGARAPTFGLESALATRGWSAVKTGTSKDLRDNWCLGWSARYTVGVWVGNAEGDPMRAVSGVAGAAPAWAAIVDHLDEAPAPAPPPGLVAVRVQFATGEPAREEWFLAGTEQPGIRAAPARVAAARIVAPADGTVLALDPDIPPRLQRVRLVASNVADAEWLVDGETVGRGDLLWTPLPGRHAIALRLGNGIADTVQVDVRGALRP
ncbi:MAG: penicillin-binding protein 1C [Chromatiales bacterium]|nr:penicillin-binding protein 1C [Chromatiales bacterium]